MTTDSERALFKASLTRATTDPLFFDHFYDSFIGESKTELAKVFENKDMANIKLKLKSTLKLVAESAERQPGLDMYFELLGKVHDRLQITPEFFAKWRDSLLKTVEATDPQSDAQTLDAWRNVLDETIAKISKPA